MSNKLNYSNVFNISSFEPHKFKLLAPPCLQHHFINSLDISLNKKHSSLLPLQIQLDKTTNGFVSTNPPDTLQTFSAFGQSQEPISVAYEIISSDPLFPLRCGKMDLSRNSW